MNLKNFGEKDNVFKKEIKNLEEGTYKKKKI